MLDCLMRISKVVAPHWYFRVIELLLSFDCTMPSQTVSPIFPKSARGSSSHILTPLQI